MYIAIKKKYIGQLDFFDPPPQTSVNSFSVAKNIKDTITNYGGLIVDDIGLNERQSRHILGENFDQIILGVLQDDSTYEAYFSLKNVILSHLQIHLPYAKDVSIVFETRYHYAHGKRDIPLCFDSHGKLDSLEIARTFTDREVQRFLDQIVTGDLHTQKYMLREHELREYLSHHVSPAHQPAIKHTSGISKKDRQAERRGLDDSFPLPQQIPGLPYVHIENNTLAIRYMIGLYTASKVKDILKDIDEQTPPYNLPRLQDMVHDMVITSRLSSYELIPDHFSRHNDVIQTRERKGRLTMRLKSLLEERQLPDISYYDGIITYLPTKAGYDKDCLFNFRPSQWQEELLRRIKEKETSAQYMNTLELLITHMEVAGVYLKKGKELLCIDRNGIHMQQELSQLIHLDQDQQQQQILQWIEEFPDIAETPKTTPHATHKEPDTVQPTKEISRDELLQQLSTVLDECFVFPDDGIDELQRRTNELLQLGISVLRDQKEIVDIATGSFKSFEDLYQDGNEFIKMAILEWFDESRSTREETIQKELRASLPKDTNETTTHNNSGPFDSDPDDDLPF